MMFVPNQFYYPYNAYAFNNAYSQFNQFNAIGQETSQRTRFTKEEDELLKQLVNSQEQPNWNEVARYMKKRTARQCRERYNNYLRPNLVNGPWSKEEDELLIQLYEKYGPKWSLISQSFNSRSPVNVKNHHSSLVSQSIVKNRKNRFDKINYESSNIDNLNDLDNEEIEKIEQKQVTVPPENPVLNSNASLIANPSLKETPSLNSNLKSTPSSNGNKFLPNINEEIYEDMFSNFQNQEELWSNNLAPTFGDDILAF